MDILLTGSNGYLGSHIIRILSDENDIFKLSRSNSMYNLNLAYDTPIFDRSFDLVIHCAGKAHSIPKNDIEFNQFYEVNVNGTINLLTGLTNFSIPRQFVFISSVSVYGLLAGGLISEESPLLASDPYGKSKIEAEELIQSWCKKNNVICTILRLPLVIGSNPPGNLASMIKGIRKGYYFNIDGGKAKKSMVLAEDVAKFIPKIKDIGGTYNLTDGLHSTLKDLSQTIAKSKIINLPLIIAKILGYLGDYLGSKAPINSLKVFKLTSDLTFDDSKAREYGWDPQNVLEYLKHNDL